MDNIQIFIIALLVVLIIFCILLKGKEQFYYTQGYYPYYYSGGYIPDYPYTSEYGSLGYRGVGSYRYPGYGPAYAKQKEEQCNIGCTSEYEYSRGKKSAKAIRDNCYNACKAASPYKG